MTAPAKHTPGPWRVAENRIGIPFAGMVVRAPDDRPVAEIWLTDIPASERKANAALIAAAPDLLAALRAMVETAASPDYGGAPSEAAMIAARAAIAKAEGRS